MSIPALQIPVPVPLDTAPAIADAAMKLRRGHRLDSANSAYEVFNDIGRPDLLRSIDITRETMGRLLGYFDPEAAPGFLPAHDGGAPELAYDLMQFIALAERHSKSVFYPRWSIGSFKRVLGGWVLVHGRTNRGHDAVTVGRAFRGLDVPIPDDMLERAGYSQWKRVLEANHVKVDDPLRQPVMPPSIERFSPDALGSLVAFVRRLGAELVRS